MRLGRDFLGQVLANGSLVVGAGGVTTELPAGAPGRVLTVTGPGIVDWAVPSAANISLNDLSDVNSAGALPGQILTFNGAVWIAQAPSGSVTQVAASGDGNIVVSGSPITSAGTLSFLLADTAVVPGTYAAPNVTVDQKGRITAITAGSSNYLSIGGGVLTGQLQIPNGTQGSPSLMMASSGGSGLYSPATNAIGVSIAGTESFRFSQFGEFIIESGSAAAAAPAIADSAFQMKIDSDSTNTGMEVHVASSSDSGGLTFARARGNLSAPTSVLNGDNLAYIAGKGFDGSNYQTVSQIIATVDGVPGPGSLPTAWSITTTPVGDVNDVERLRVGNDGTIYLGGETGSGSEEALRVVRTANSVNRVEVSGNVTGSNPSVSAKGLDTDVSLDINAKGAGHVNINGTNGVVVPVGTTAQRPGTPPLGMIRLNTSTSQFEGWNGTSWVVLG